MKTMANKKLIAAGLLFLLAHLPIMAQGTKQFTLDDLMWGGSNYWNIQPRSVFTTWWGDRLVETKVEELSLLFDNKGKKVEKNATLCTLSDINAAIDTAAFGKVRTLTGASFPEANGTVVRVRADKGTVDYDWTKKQIVFSMLRPEGNLQATKTAPVTSALAYVKDYNIYIRTREGKDLTVTTDGTRELQYGLTVHRNEFGINEGLFWSPKGNLLAFYRMDQSMVTDFPLIDIFHRVAQLAPEKYPMAGMTSHKVTVGIFNPATGQTVYLKAGDPTDRYFTNIAWSPDESTVYMFELPRTQDKAELVAYDAVTGERKGVLYTETNERYVEPMTPIVFLPWDASKFVMQSRRDGYNHFYLFDTTGKQLAQLTKGAFEVIDFLGFNEQTKSIVYLANEQSPVRHNLYSVQVASGKRQLLDNGEGVHRASLSAGGRFLCDRWSKPDTYRQVDFVNTSNGKKQAVQERIATPWADFNVPEITGGSIKAADGTTDLYYRLVKPVGFDPAKKYPTVVYVYGGPHANNVEESWNFAARPWEIYMAQRGYVLFVIDNRGSQYRGFDFESCTHRHLGDIEMKDQLKGVEFLKTLPYVDADRLGVHGWSFGGYMTTNLMCSYPDVFKVGVAGGPVIDWKYYEVMYGERYMDTPQENPDGYESSSLLPKAKNLKGRLQIIVGLNDGTCVLQHSLAFLRACEDVGTQPDYFVYPGQEHNMMGRDMVHLHERITRYFDDYLK